MEHVEIKRQISFFYFDFTHFSGILHIYILSNKNRNHVSMITTSVLVSIQKPATEHHWIDAKSEQIRHND